MFNPITPDPKTNIFYKKKKKFNMIPHKKSPLKTIKMAEMEIQVNHS